MADKIRARVERAFEANSASGREVGASVSVWKDGHEIVSLAAGHRDAARSEPWAADTVVLVWSATKGPAAACVLHALSAAGLDPETPVASFWPEFAAGGKSRLTVGNILSHSAGLGAMRAEGISILDHTAVVTALAAQEPFAELLPGPAYGPRASGFLMDEIVRRLTGAPSLSSYWQQHFVEPLGLDFWIGLPPSEDARLARMLPPRFTGEPGDPFLRAFSDPASLTRRAFAFPAGLAAASAMNQEAGRRSGLASMGGFGTASALAKFYAVLAAGGHWQGRQIFSPEALAWMTTRRASGVDEILRHPVTFSAGFMLDPIAPSGHKLRQTMGPSFTAFGHPGAGGSLAFADPETGISFAYVMNQMEPGVLPNDRAHSLVRATFPLDDTTAGIV